MPQAGFRYAAPASCAGALQCYIHEVPAPVDAAGTMSPGISIYYNWYQSTGDSLMQPTGVLGSHSMLAREDVTTSVLSQPDKYPQHDICSF
jgi:hypothetical protein